VTLDTEVVRGRPRGIDINRELHLVLKLGSVLVDNIVELGCGWNGMCGGWLLHLLFLKEGFALHSSGGVILLFVKGHTLMLFLLMIELMIIFWVSVLLHPGAVELCSGVHAIGNGIRSNVFWQSSGACHQP
jgi:hypothetical protein